MSSQELQSLQRQNREKDEEITTLKRLNTELETTRNKFIQLHTEEKNEKKAVQEKYDHAQIEHHREVQKHMTRFHLAIGVAAILLVVLAVLHRETI